MLARFTKLWQNVGQILHSQHDTSQVYPIQHVVLPDQKI